MPDLTIIGGAGEGDGPPSVVRRRRGPGAGCVVHRHLVLDHDAHRVFCDDCGSEVDPFAGLAMLSQEMERWVVARDRARGDARRAMRELEDVKRELRNAKGRLRRARAREE